MATLVFHIDDEQEIVVPLSETVTVGSSEGNDVLVEDSTISPKHAEVAVSATGNFVVRDLGSDAGTFVNGRRIKAYPLCEGDEVAFGGLRGRFILDDKDRATALERENEERDMRRRLEQIQREHDEARRAHEESNAKHRMVLSLLQGLGEEEKKRMDNLDKLQRAINGAEGTLAAAEASAKKFRDEAAQGEKLLKEHAAERARLEDELSKITASLEAARKEQGLQGEKLRKEHAEERTGLEEEIARITARRDAAVKEEELQVEKLRAERTKIEGDIPKITARRDAAIAEEKLALDQARSLRLKEFEAHKATFQKELDGVVALQEAARGKLEAMDAERAKSAAAMVEQQKFLALEESRQKEAKDATAKSEAELAKSLANSKEELAKARAGIEAELAKALAESKAALEKSLAENEAELKKSLAANEAAIAKAREEKQRAVKAQEKARQQLQDLLGEKHQASEEVGALSKQKAALSASLATLELAVKDMAQRQTDGILALRERERGMREVLKGMERTKAEQAEMAMVSRELEAERAKLQASLDGFAAQVKSSEGRLEELDQAATAKKDEIAALADQIKQRKKEHDTVLERVEALAGTEAALLEARKDLDKAKEEHAAFVALTAERETRQSEVNALNVALEQLHATRVKAEQALAAAQASHKDFERDAAAGRERLATEARSLDGEIAQKKKDLSALKQEFATLQQQLQEATARHHELLEKSKELTGVEDELRKTTAELSRARQDKQIVEAAKTAAEKESQSAREKLQSLDAEVASIMVALASRRDDFAALSNQFEQTAAGHDKLLRQSKELAGVEGELQKAKAELVRVQHDKLVIEESTAAVEKESQARRAKLQTLEAEVAAVADSLTGRRNDLAAISDQLQKSVAEYEKLLGRSRELAGVEEALRKANADLSQSQRQRAELDAAATSLKKESQALDATVRQLQTDLKGVNAAVDRRREEEAAVNKAVAALQAEQAIEARRLSDIRMAAFEAERKAAANLAEMERKANAERAEMERKSAADRAELDAAYEKRRRQVLDQEDQFHAMVSLREEIDALYSRIESSGEENASATLAAWKAAKKKKDELTELLPKGGGIRVKPQGRTVLVPRSKES